MGRQLILPAFIVLLGVGAAIVEPRFASAANLANLAIQLMPLLIIAVGQSFAIISGGLDLSMGAVLSLAGVVGALVMQDAGVAAGVGAMLATGVAVGLLNGVIIAYLRTSPLVVTLGMLSVAQAIALMLVKGTPIYNIAPAFIDFVGYTRFLYLPVVVWIGILTTALGAIILRKTIFGRYVYAIGSNSAAAHKSGINVRWFTLLVYAFSGLCAGIAAMVVTAWTSSAQPIAAPEITLQALAAVVLGGVALTGGRGGMFEVICGVTVLGMLSNVMNMIGVSSYFQMLAIGIVIIVAVILDRFRRQEMAK
ncbi:ABC transporter permease [Paenalcaligenes niemegkensis]|uniref:ABC transporter permease n=1 Tax=Paenalcaligenes niemegkensis TaxID=2895469 RepID=UPI001EE93544|nr:ABC transporter permease [Paenalcaligenes niemegkensis]MCQ9617550.1 ABC transporter permease [Paenalcaligenes niemegkensis]